jgi:hypothetical protein
MRFRMLSPAVAQITVFVIHYPIYVGLLAESHAQILSVRSRDRRYHPSLI